ncbi:semaphorin-5A-like [Ruditapes philippinarum]|uniref:semaphorin-5A-like n=1 Tax=Ruditapes philippinarum TaxID=129788 RepID=UPI00295B9F2B|nr:semaphorin-5A-like [Ruditapes philippinarum]XP_060588037.1 semaphorin-5A-like [Ruditapes philippinarum]
MRKRTCISGFKGNDCLNLQGKYYEQLFCDESCNDTDTISENRDGWSDWRCMEQGDFCFISRTCTSTADFNCSKTSEVTVTNCPCAAEWSPWGGWTCHTDQNVCLKLRKRTCISGFKGNDCLNLQGKNYEQIRCDESCNDNASISGYRDGWSDWSCEKQGDFCFKSRTCNSTADFNCSNTSEVTVINCPCIAEWSPWGEWTCHIDHGLCLQLRQRTCISGFKDNDCLTLQGEHFEETLCDGLCNATLTTEPLSTSKPLGATTTSGVHWLEWSDWECKTAHRICLMSRTRNCSTHIVDDCEIKLGGVYFNTELCRAEICTATQLSPLEQKSTTSSPSNYYATTTTSSFSMPSSAFARFISSTAPNYVTSQTA